jgi:hypothetical protein
MTTKSDAQAEAIERLYRDRRRAHRVLFPHTHETPEFHGEIIDLFHGADPAVCIIGFRGSAKSTLAEEGLTIKALFREFRHAMIVGSSLDRAAERLHAIRRHLERNEAIRTLFGDLRGQPWGDDKLELSTGITIQAMGRGQAIRGTKTEEVRPDFILADDIEDELSVRSAEGREKVQKWFFGELLPSGDGPNLKVRMPANDMHPECLANKLKAPGSGFIVKVYPWEYRDEAGHRRATWPGRFPLELIDMERNRFYALGRGADYESEFMCHSESPESKPFKSGMLKIEPVLRSWHAVYSMKDPARTVGKQSALTGSAVWSWIANRLIVWDLWARPLMPDQIVEALFAEEAQYHPVAQGFEEDGLNEWALQPIRHEQVKRGVMLPLRPMKAPKGKTDFIRGLQPFFQAGEIIFAKEMGEAWSQFLAFPSGLIDAPNALAYALKMRPGAPIYEDFHGDNASLELAPTPGRPLNLVLNASRTCLAAALVQYERDAFRVFADWVREGDTAELLGSVLAEARVEAADNFGVICPPAHFDRFNNVGLVQAARRGQREMKAGDLPAAGVPEIRRLLKARARGFPALMVAEKARWTLNAFAGGYARSTLKNGALADFAEEGPYRVLMEGIESFCGLLAMGVDGEDERNYAYTSGGKRYMTTRPQEHAGPRDLKNPDWQDVLDQGRGR